MCIFKLMLIKSTETVAIHTMRLYITLEWILGRYRQK